MAAAESPSARQAALLVHGLPAPARRQVLERLACADGAQVAQALASRSAWTVTRVVGAAAWPWRAQVLDALPPTLRDDVRAALHDAPEPPPPALAQALFACLLQELARAHADPVVSARPRRTPWWTACARRLVAWRPLRWNP